MTRPARRSAIALVAAWICAAAAAGASITDLFQKVKVQVAAADWAGGLRTLQELEAEAARPENEKARTALQPAAAFYRGVCLASLGRSDEAIAAFAVYIAAFPDKTIDRKAYAKAVVEAFDKASRSRKSDGAEPLSALASAYRQTTYPRPDPAPPGPDWAAGPIRFLLTPEEARAYSRIASDSERGDFVQRFWNGDRPGSREELRREFERRAAFADEHFAEKDTRGSLTDRGMVFLLLGPPSGVLRRPISAAEDTPGMLSMGSGTNPAPKSSVGISPSDQPSNWREVWRYNRDLLPADAPYSYVDFSFQTRIDYGRNVLQRDAAPLRTLESARQKWRVSSP